MKFSREQFTAELLPLLNKYCPPDIPVVPAFAQAWLETAHGSSAIFNNTCNPWNITTGGSFTPNYAVPGTTEYKNGKPFVTTIKYRVYPNLESAVKDYCKVIRGQYLNGRKVETIEEFAGIVSGNNKGKYKFATAPGYERNLIKTYNNTVLPYLQNAGGSVLAGFGGGVGLLALLGIGLGVYFAR